MNTVFPVEIRTGDAGRLLQAFTCDVSHGGLCLELKSFGKETEKSLLVPGRVIHLTINPSFSGKPIQASASIAWFEKNESEPHSVYRIGVAYTQIDPSSRQRLIRFAKTRFWMPRIAAGAGVAMLVFISVLIVREQSLAVQNRLLVRQLVESADKRSHIASSLNQIQKKKTDLEKELVLAKEALKTQTIQLELKALERGRRSLRKDFENLKNQSRLADTKVLDQMVDWIRSHQNIRTGLVASFEGDPGLEHWAFTYDQSLACQVFLLFGDYGKAAAILSFYRDNADKRDKIYFNAYDSTDGRAVESTVHTGPNIWIGLAALQYERKVKDGRFVKLAQQMGDWVIRFQDEEGGVKGGPDADWYSTEHNLDAYAFLSMLVDQTRDERYRDAAERTLAWLRKYAYSLQEKRVHRGKGDATISTDTLSWSIAALGPERLLEIGFDPEGIIDFAEKNCLVSVKFPHPDDGKTIAVRGFDFAKASHIGRGGIISTEWTAQMIVTYRILADYFKSRNDAEKSGLYRDKADFYLNELQKLVITSPSRTGQGRGSLPYASMSNADTGHGWRTPAGRQTGSVAGTAYGIFAWAGYNPFDGVQKEHADLHV